MRRITSVMVLGLLCFACGGGVDSFEEGMEAQISLTEEMMDVLADVNDEASAKAAVPEIEALGQQLAELATKLQALPQPSMEELQKLGETHSKRMQNFQQKALAQMMKLAQYPELAEAMTQALSDAYVPK